MFHAGERSLAEAGLFGVVQNAVPDFHMASSIVASLRATVTIPFFMQIRFAMRSPTPSGAT